MKVNKLVVENFTVFEKVELNLCDGVNVFIGTNATGKTHLLKLAYSLLRTFQDIEKSRKPGKRLSQSSLSKQLGHKLENVFQPSNFDLTRLIRRDGKQDVVQGTLLIGNTQYTVTGSYSRTVECKPAKSLSGVRCLFIPSHEFLASYEGFIAAYQDREISFDETYYDLCVALSAARLRRKRTNGLSKLIDRLEGVLGGKLELAGGRFEIATDAGSLEAHLMAEGHRKIGTIVQLLANGSLRKDAFLFWDEPEANLNTKLITTVSEVLRHLAKFGVQVFVASHDYLLTSELSMAAEYQTEPKVPIRFFAFSKKGPNDPVTVQSGDTLPDLDDNPILEEFAAHYDREHAEIAKSLKRKGSRN